MASGTIILNDGSVRTRVIAEESSDERTLRTKGILEKALSEYEDATRDCEDCALNVGRAKRDQDYAERNPNLTDDELRGIVSAHTRTIHLLDAAQFTVKQRTAKLEEALEPFRLECTEFQKVVLDQAKAIVRGNIWAAVQCEEAPPPAVLTAIGYVSQFDKRLREIAACAPHLLLTLKGIPLATALLAKYRDLLELKAKL